MVFSSLMARLVELRGRPLTRRLNCSVMRLSSLTAFFLAGVVLLQPASAALARSTPHERLASELLPPHEPAEQSDENLRATTFTPDSAASEIQDRKSTRLNSQSLMRISNAVCCLKKKKE